MPVDMIKRRKIMDRSRKLGHCICDPKKSCPCDILKKKNICPCAGEKIETIAVSEVRLMQHVHNAGCASKISAVELEKILAGLPSQNDPRIISGIPAGDDAGVFKINEEITIVQTVDVFTPCVDDPYTFGQIAACNSVSDIYAMGGKPLTALSILAFPTDTLPGEVVRLIMKGGMDKLNEAGVAIIGGHSIKDDEVKFGFAVTGVIAQNSISTIENLQPGDCLILTKPIGTGVIAFAGQIGRASEKSLEQIKHSMIQLNRQAAEVMQKVGASACTDITGFGLFGHLIKMARHSGVTVNIFSESIPVFDEALSLIREEIIPGAIERNREYVAEDISISEDVDPAIADLGFDAQTSGGLLIAVKKDRVMKLAGLLEENEIQSALIGEVLEPSKGKILLTRQDTDKKRVISMQGRNNMKKSSDNKEENNAPCCAPIHEGKDNNLQETKSKFQEFIAAANSTGAVDARQKELVVYALSVLAKCGSCIKMHYQKAVSTGITPEELDEVAWLAIQMGGAPVMVFYTEIKKDL